MTVTVSAIFCLFLAACAVCITSLLPQPKMSTDKRTLIDAFRGLAESELVVNIEEGYSDTFLRSKQQVLSLASQVVSLSQSSDPHIQSLVREVQHKIVSSQAQLQICHVTMACSLDFKTACDDYMELYREVLEQSYAICRLAFPDAGETNPA